MEVGDIHSSVRLHACHNSDSCRCLDSPPHFHLVIVCPLLACRPCSILSGLLLDTTESVHSVVERPSDYCFHDVYAYKLAKQ